MKGMSSRVVGRATVRCLGGGVGEDLEADEETVLGRGAAGCGAADDEVDRREHGFGVPVLHRRVRGADLLLVAADGQGRRSDALVVLPLLLYELEELVRSLDAGGDEVAQTRRARIEVVRAERVLALGRHAVEGAPEEIDVGAHDARLQRVAGVGRGRFGAGRGAGGQESCQRHGGRAAHGASSRPPS